MTAVAPLSLRRLNRATLARQGLLERLEGTPAAAVRQLAGLQAQHANQPYIALWSRLAGFQRGDLEQALLDRAVVKATVMRGTLHLVAAEDFPIFDAAVSPSRIGVWQPSATRAGVDLADLHATLLAFCHEPRTVEEMERHLDEVLPDSELSRYVPSGVRHVAFRMASTGGGLVHAPPSGLWAQHGKPRYVAASTWTGIAQDARPDPDTARATAIERFLGAYGPASMADIGRWLGNTRVGTLRATVERLGDRLHTLRGEDGRELLDLVGAGVAAEDLVAPPRFLSRWDSVLIAYDDRDRILPPSTKAAVIKKNGDVLPTFLVDGVVAGLWSATRAKALATLTLEPFGTVGRADRAALEAEGERLVRFIDPEAADHRVVWA